MSAFSGLMARWQRLGEWLLGRTRRPRPMVAPAQRAAELLTEALAEEDPGLRVARLSAALSAGERLGDGAGDIVVMEAALHLGERMRADGQRDQAVRLFASALERSFRVPDPIGRHRRAGVLSRLGIIEQEQGEIEAARQRYEEALALGADAEGSLLLGMLTQAAFNLGILDSERGDERQAQSRWEQAIALGERSGHASGWDPAAIAAFNLGHLLARRGEPGAARARLESVRTIAESGGTALGLMASAKAELALGAIAEQEGLFGEAEAARHYHRAIELGGASQLSDGSLAAVQAALALGEQAVQSGRVADAAPHYRRALTLVTGCDETTASRFRVLGTLRLGQVLAESGAREEAARLLAESFQSGRESGETWVRELAGQAACNLHRVLGALERWDDARALADEALAFTRTLSSGLGRALEAAATYAQAFQALHDGDTPRARAGLDAVARLGRDSGIDVGERVAVDALLLAAHLDRQARRFDAAAEALLAAVSLLRERSGPEADATMAMAQVNLGHVRMGQERALEAQHAYRRALERGGASGAPAGRAAAANAALNLGALLSDEASDENLREWFESARTLGRASGTPLGEECARQADRALERLARGERPGGDADGGDENGL